MRIVHRVLYSGLRKASSVLLPKGRRTAALFAYSRRQPLVPATFVTLAVF